MIRFLGVIQGSSFERYKVTIYTNAMPSLVRGSAQQLNITKVKTDPNDNTVGLSVLVLSALNKSMFPLLEIVIENLSNCWKLLRAY